MWLTNQVHQPRSLGQQNHRPLGPPARRTFLLYASLTLLGNMSHAKEVPVGVQVQGETEACTRVPTYCRPEHVHSTVTTVMLLGLVPFCIGGYCLSALLLQRRTRAVQKAFRWGHSHASFCGCTHGVNITDTPPAGVVGML